MHPRTEEMLRHLDENRAVLRAAVDGVPPTARETRPAPDQWSVAEVLEHLTRVETGLTRILTKRLAEADATSAFLPDAETGSVVATINNELLVDRRHKITAGERVVPTGEMSSDTAWASLETLRQDLKALVRARNDLVHRLLVLPGMDLLSEDGRRRAVDYLDSQFEDAQRFKESTLPLYEFLQDALGRMQNDTSARHK